LGNWYISRGPMHHKIGEERGEKGLFYVMPEFGKEAEFAEPLEPLHPKLQAALKKLQIKQLYAHQAESIDAVREGKHLALVTPTASGKTLCFNLPVLETILKDIDRDKSASSTALYVFPVNALLNDQHTKINELIANLGITPGQIRASRYNGFMSKEEKQAVRSARPHILLTNPEMINLAMLGWHQQWGDFYRNLKYIVLDEVHTYRGVFGSQTAHLIRRLRRICALYGSNPQFICCSATIGNPLELITNLTGLPEKDFHLIPPDRNGAKRSTRHFVVLNPPPYQVKRETTGWGKDTVTHQVAMYRPLTEELADLTGFLLSEPGDLSLLCFNRSRQQAETLVRLCRNRLPSSKGNFVRAYRAGYRSEEREEIEQKLKQGELRAVFATNALEMGIDIGGLDVVLIAGYPGSQMALRQQAGRAGRGAKDALVVLMTSRNPLDQYFATTPNALATGKPENAFINLLNWQIARSHLLAAAKESPISELDFIEYYPAEIFEMWEKELTSQTRERGHIEERAKNNVRWWRFTPADNFDPHRHINLRSSSDRRFNIVNLDSGKNLGTIEPPNVYRETYPNAIYVHGGETYRVEELNPEKAEVMVRPLVSDMHTEVVEETSVDIVSISAEQTHRFTPESRLFITESKGKLAANQAFTGYREINLTARSKRYIGNDKRYSEPEPEYPLEPAYYLDLNTTGMWLTIPPHEAFGPIGDYEAGVQALENILTGLFPVLVICDKQDVDSAHTIYPGESTVIYFFDSYEGGAGISEGNYGRANELLEAAYRAVSQCPCTEGCPSCVQSGKTGARGKNADKKVCLRLLERLLGKSITEGEIISDSSVAIELKAIMPPQKEFSLVVEPSNELAVNPAEKLEQLAQQIMETETHLNHLQNLLKDLKEQASQLLQYNGGRWRTDLGEFRTMPPGETSSYNRRDLDALIGRLTELGMPEIAEAILECRKTSPRKGYTMFVKNKRAGDSTCDDQEIPAED
jgi:DEAD/DEAH box helicase domain-containing protein